MLLLGIVIGVGLSVLAYWFWLKPSAEQQQDEMRRFRKALGEKERAFESRLKDTVQSLQRDHQSQLEERASNLKQQYEGQIQSLKAQRTAPAIDPATQPPIQGIATAAAATVASVAAVGALTAERIDPVPKAIAPKTPVEATRSQFCGGAGGQWGDRPLQSLSR